MGFLRKRSETKYNCKPRAKWASRAAEAAGFCKRKPVGLRRSARPFCYAARLAEIFCASRLTGKTECLTIPYRQVVLQRHSDGPLEKRRSRSRTEGPGNPLGPGGLDRPRVDRSLVSG